MTDPYRQLGEVVDDHQQENARLREENARLEREIEKLHREKDMLGEACLNSEKARKAATEQTEAYRQALMRANEKALAPHKPLTYEQLSVVRDATFFNESVGKIESVIRLAESIRNDWKTHRSDRNGPSLEGSSGPSAVCTECGARNDDPGWINNVVNGLCYRHRPDACGGVHR